MKQTRFERSENPIILCNEYVNGHFWSNLCLNCIFKWTWFVKTNIWSVIDRSRVRFPVAAALIFFFFLSLFCTFLIENFHWKTGFSASCMSIFDRLMHYFVVLVITILITPPLWRPLICNTFFLLKKCIYLKVDCLCPTARGAAAKFYLFWHDVKRWGHFISVLFFSMCRHSTDGSWGNGSEHDESRDLLDWSNNVIHTDSISQCIFGLQMSHEEIVPFLHRKKMSPRKFFPVQAKMLSKKEL